VAGSWIGLRKALRVLSFLRLCLTSPASVALSQPLSFWPGKNRVWGSPLKSGPRISHAQEIYDG